MGLTKRLSNSNVRDTVIGPVDTNASGEGKRMRHLRGPTQLKKG